MSFFGDRREQARAQVDSWLAVAYPGAAPVSGAVLAEHGLDRDGDGWRVPLPHGGTLLLGLGVEFPYCVPRAALEGREHALDPHVEKGLKLCLAGDDARVDAHDPVALVRSTIEEALALLTDNAGGRNAGDFAIDFPAYWRRTEASSRPVWTLLDDAQGTREVRAWYGGNADLVSEYDEEGLRWLEHRYGEAERTMQRAVVVWCDPLPVPKDYPQTVNDVRKLDPAAAALIDPILAELPDRLLVVLAGPTGDGRVTRGAVRLEPAVANGRSRSRAGYRGFRPGRVPPAPVLACHWRVQRVPAVPVGSAVSRLPTTLLALAEKRVAVFGCGSLGAGVARLLVQSGVGRVTLVDPATLRFENIGRHELGAPEVGAYKAESLAKRLRSSYPQVREVAFHNGGWLDFLRRQGDAALDEFDLIVSATGDWNAEAALSDFQRGRPLACPVVYAWMERNAAAAHVVALGREGACFRCGFDSTGNALLPATSWEASMDNPGCAAPVSPYGAIDLAQAQATVSEVVAELLLDRAGFPLHRVWYGRAELLNSAGGRWNAAWSRVHGEPGRGGTIGAATWPLHQGCSCR